MYTFSRSGKTKRERTLQEKSRREREREEKSERERALLKNERERERVFARTHLARTQTQRERKRESAKAQNIRHKRVCAFVVVLLAQKNEFWGNILLHIKPQRDTYLDAYNRERDT